MPENTRITKTFTYDIADAYLYQTNDLKRSAEWTYEGPQYIWCFADATTKKILGRFHYTERDNGADIVAPDGQIKILVDADKNPEIASLFHDEHVYGDLLHTVENLPDGSTYGHPDPIQPDHTYELEEIEWDEENQDFVKPYPWKKPHMTWDILKEVRNNLLRLSDSTIRTASDEDKLAWEEYRQALRDLTTTFDGIDPWKVPFPQSPDMPSDPLKPAE